MIEDLTSPFRVRAAGPELDKAATGIAGLDEITRGGLPRNRSTLLVGGAGSGKTMLGVEFLVRGARDFGEPGVLLSFEESAAKLAENAISLGFDLDHLQRDGRLAVQAFRIDPTEIIETGEFDLEGLFVCLAAAVAQVNARRVVIDTIEILFGAFRDSATIRGELGRLFRWLDDHDLTAIVTGERGERQLTRHGIEEYVSDCVVVLDHRVTEETSTRRIRILKYRGSLHGTNEYPFLITGGGIVVQPLSSVRLAHQAPTERLSTGVPRLDQMLGGGIYHGSTTLVSGNAGTGKTTVAAQLVSAACERGEQALYVSYEESPEQLMRNMRSVGIDLRRWVEQGLLHFSAVRPAAYGLENHLDGLTRLVDDVRPSVGVLDGLGGFGYVASDREVTSVVTRMVDLLKSRQVAAILTALAHDDHEMSQLAVSSLIDTWLLLRNVESDGERNRLLFVIKSRGTRHSNQVREFVLTDSGPELVDVYLGTDGMRVGSARVNRQLKEREEELRRAAALSDRQRELRRQAAECQAQIAALQEALTGTHAEIARLDEERNGWEVASAAGRDALRRQRLANLTPFAGGQHP